MPSLMPRPPAHFYNDTDAYCCSWLSNLMDAALIPPGDICSDSISDIDPYALKSRNYTQCHFFAGIAGWPLALHLAGWPADRPVWTGSCPCQPFSVAGKRGGTFDPRHLWPSFARLIAYCRPPAVFGEQVASADGKLWLSGVRLDLEDMGYGVGVADLCAAGVGAPQIRQRLYWAGGMAHSQRPQRGPRTVQRTDDQHEVEARQQGTGGSGECGELSGLGYAKCYANQSRRFTIQSKESDGTPFSGTCVESGRSSDLGFWSDYTLIPCLDSTSRRIEPGTFPLAHGVPARMGKLRAYGNAIVPQVAAEFIAAYLETEHG